MSRAIRLFWRKNPRILPDVKVFIVLTPDCMKILELLLLYIRPAQLRKLEGPN